jgi:RNA polymerase sigma-70 factor (ECF subfamily)
VPSPTAQPTARAAHDADRRLARQVASGDAAAIEAFLDRVSVVGPVLAVRNRRMGAPLSEADLDDLTQDTIVVIWRKLPTYAGEGALEAWFYKICSFELLNAVRRARRRSPQSQEPTSEPWYVEEAGTSESAAMRSVLRHLADREAEVVLLKHFDQLSFSEIGELLDLATTTVKTHYYRGIDKLRDAFRGAASGSGETRP